MDGQEPIMIFGRVTRSDGAPVPGAALTLCDLSGDQLDRAAADDGGQFQLVPSTGGTYLVICASSTHRPQASLVAVADRPLRHDVALDGGGASLGGTVGVRHGGGSNGTAGTAEATGVSGWSDVVLTLTDARGAVVAVSHSGADGGYHFGDLTEGTYTLTAAVPRVAPVAETVRVPAEGHVTHDVALATRTELSGTVRSAGAGRPVAEALATLVSEDGHVVGSRVTGEDGSFRFDDVPRGVYTITASGYAPVAAEIEVGPGHPSDVVLNLVPPAVDGGPARPDPAHGDDAAPVSGNDVAPASSNGIGGGDGRHVHGDDVTETPGTPSGDERW